MSNIFLVQEKIMKILKTESKNKQPRRGCRDIWNAFMAKKALFGKHDIPLCPTTATQIPSDIITWEEAKNIHNKRRQDERYSYPAYVCFYLDDYKFDTPNGIWNNPLQALSIIRHFEGVITPDYSTYQDFPEPLKIYATYRMRLFGYWLGKNGIQVINNVRWGTSETWDYCFEGIPHDSIVAIGTVGGNPRRLVDRTRFNEGFERMIKTLHPKTIIVYGSSLYPCFKDAVQTGISVISFKSATARAFANKKGAENE